MGITKDVVESFTWKILESSVPGCTDPESLQGLFLKFEEDRKILHVSVENIFYWISNGSPPWAANHAFMSSHLISLKKNPCMRPVRISKHWIHLFEKCAMKVKGPKSPNACQHDHIYDELKEGIDGAAHRVHDIWDANSPTESWGFLLLDINNNFNKVNCIGILCTVFHLWTSVACSKISIVNDHRSSWKTGMGRPVFCTVGRVRRKDIHLIWSPIILAFSHWFNSQKRNFLKSPSPGTLKMSVHLENSQMSSYILIY